MPKLLVIDDEPAILETFRRLFHQPDLTVLTSPAANPGLDLAMRHRPDLVMLDVDLPDLSGLEAFRRLRQFDPKIPVIFMTGHTEAETAIEATKLGALDYLFKPLDPEELEELVERGLRISHLMRVPPMLPDEQVGEIAAADILVGRAPTMREVYLSIGRVAPQDVTVLVLGESGTGKELVARAVYHHSSRAAGPFRVVNCAAIPETLLESELFGHEKGAFTGADRLRIGKFEQASGGTLFLDEIGDMTPLTQAKVLRVLQDRQFERVGGDETITADVRIVAATNRDLAAMAAAGRFRADLFYRLSVFTIHLPALRDRGDDLRLLTEHFVRRFARELRKEVREIAPAVHETLRGYSWPGNVRELQSVLKQALIRASGPILAAEFLPSSILSPAGDAAASSTGAPGGLRDEWDRFIQDQLRGGTTNLYADWLSLAERHLLRKVLDHTGGNQSRAASMLGITRRTLRTKLRLLGLEQ